VKTSNPKNKGGRPLSGRVPFSVRAIRLPDELVAKIDGWADHENISRSEAVRRLLEQALAAKRKR
jgi:metal-responsive CopG/Arc/MetJ family transcriptional regulator